MPVVCDVESVEQILSRSRTEELLSGSGEVCGVGGLELQSGEIMLQLLDLTECLDMYSRKPRQRELRWAGRCGRNNRRGGPHLYHLDRTTGYERQAK